MHIVQCTDAKISGKYLAEYICWWMRSVFHNSRARCYMHAYELYYKIYKCAVHLYYYRIVVKIKHARQNHFISYYCMPFLCVRVCLVKVIYLKSHISAINKVRDIVIVATVKVCILHNCIVHGDIFNVCK